MHLPLKIKIFFLIGILLGLKAGSFAQKGFQIGVQATPQMSWLINKEDLNNLEFGYKNTYNGAFGLLIQYGFTEGMGVGVNAMYSFQGQRYNFSGAEYVRKVEYIKIPLLYVFNYQVYPNVLFIGKVGPQFDILTNAKLSDKNGTDIIPNQAMAYENFDVGGTAFAGLGFKITEALYVDVALRYDYSFTDAESKGYKYNINHPVSFIGNSGRNPQRPITNNTTAGVNFGIRYVIK